MASSAQVDDEMWKYAMDDLSRGRQEELPLEARPKRGPTFNPSGRNSVDHIPKKQKLALISAWGNPVRDEESEQMEGLVLPDFPWRRGQAQQPPNPTESEPGPSGDRRSRGGKQSNNDFFAKGYNSSHKGTARSEGRPNAPSARETRSSAQRARSGIPARFQGPVKDNTSSLRVFREERVPENNKTRDDPANFNRVAEGPPLTIPPPEPQKWLGREHWQEELRLCEFYVNEPPDTGTPHTEWIFYHGYCLVYPNANPNNYFRAKFLIKMKFPSAEEGLSGSFILSKKGLPDRIHPVDQLNRPLLECPGGVERLCVISTLGPIPSASYRLELKDLATTKKLVDCLKGIQMTIHTHRAQTESDGAVHTTKPEGRELVIIDSSDDESTAGDDHDSDVMILDGPCSSVTSNDDVANKRQNNRALANGNPLVDVSEVDTRVSTQRALEAISQVAQNLTRVRDDRSSSLEDLEPLIEKFLVAEHPILDARARSNITKSFRDILLTVTGHNDRQEVADHPKSQFPTSMAEFLQPIRYDPETLQKLKGNGTLPEAARATIKEISSQGVSKGWLSQVWNPNRDSDEQLAETFAQLTASEPKHEEHPEPKSTANNLGNFNNGLAPSASTPWVRPKKGLSSSIFA